MGVCSHFPLPARPFASIQLAPLLVGGHPDIQGSITIVDSVVDDGLGPLRSAPPCRTPPATSPDTTAITTSSMATGKTTPASGLGALPSLSVRTPLPKARRPPQCGLHIRGL